MKKNFISDERFSFAHPNAESTMNGTFQWGRKDLNNSSISSNSKGAKSPPKNCLSKVDARVYTDAQSRGLASRIVKYHESGTRLNRSVSMSNLCGKSSPLSIRKLEAKPLLRYDKAIKQNVSMTHIAPPDKSLFYGNTLSGLLRSSSVIQAQPRDDDFSSENRPIIHPPVTDKELQPTRSVLEVLKEISRKRINNEVLPDNDEVIDNAKKYCGRFVETAHYGVNDYRAEQQQIRPTTSTYKRQRESAVDGYMAPVCQSRDANSYQGNTDQPELPSSPEQQSKRRHCNYNNDITSSLSSSVKSSTSKRKLCESDSYKRQEKLLRYQSEIRLPEISSASNYEDKSPITPLPNTPQTVSNDIPIPVAIVKKSASAPLPETADAQDANTKPKLTLFNRNYETKADVDTSKGATQQGTSDDYDAYSDINFVKPKKTGTGINANSASNLVMERTRKSKLALMLSGLRGELYHGDEEEEQRLKGIEPNKISSDKQKDSTKPQQVQISPITLTNNLNDKQETTNADKIDACVKTPTTSTATSVVVSTVAVPTTIQSTKITSPLTGIKLTPIAVASTTNSTTTNATAATHAAPTLKFGVSVSGAATADKLNLNFVAPATTTNVTAAVSTTTSTFSFGLPTISTTIAKPSPIMQLTSVAASTASQPLLTSSTAPLNAVNSTFNFNLSSADKNQKIISTTAVTSGSLTATVSAGFTFGSNTTTSSVASTTTTSSTTTPATASFTFGGLAAAQSTNKPLATTMPATNTTAGTTAGFNFGTKHPASSFSFGANTTTNVTTTATTTVEATSIFSLTSTSKTANTAASGAFAFGSNNASENKTTTQPSTTFGSVNKQVTTTPFSFGPQQTDQVKNAALNNSLIFGAKTAPNQEKNNAPNNSFIFGNVNANAVDQATKPSSTFGPPSSNINQGGLFSLNTVTNSGTAAPSSNEGIKTSNAFSFSNAAPAAPTKAFSFGANAVNDSSKSTNLFGAALGNNLQSKSFSFGSQNAALSTNETPKATPSSFNFSSSNQGNNAFTFGGVSGNTNANSNSPANAFSAVTTGANNKPLGGAFNFGQASNNAANAGIFSFGATQNKTNSSVNIADQGANKPSTTNTTNTFGGFSNPSSTSPSSGSFVFGTAKTDNTAKVSTPAFGLSSASNNTTNNGFVFGASKQQNSSASGNLFASSSAATGVATVQPNNLFGGSANTSTATNIFSNTNSTPLFGAAVPLAGSMQPPQTPANNLLAVQAGTDRPIRRATRRLAKP